VRTERQTRTPQFPGRGQKTERCPDCEYEERLNLLGQPIYNRALGIQQTFGCETCQGTGRVPRALKGVDPYEIPKKG